MSENLYKKYRPQTFDEIIGHEKVLLDLKKRMKLKTWPNVIYLTGPTGVGKTTIARIIAKCLTCEYPKEDGTPCNECDYCLDIINEEFMLACEEYNASNLGIDEVREIEQKANLQSLTSSVRIFFIDELQELSSSKKAQKNLLKCLERKEEDVYFILGSMDDNKVNKAVKDRGSYYKLQPLKFDEIGEYLISIMKREGIEVSEDKYEALFCIGENCDGSVRKATNYLERCIYSNLWNPEDILKELSIVSQDKLIYICADILQGNVKVLENPIDKEVVEKIRNMLVDAFKVASGLETPYLRNRVKNLPSLGLPVIVNTLEELNKLYSYVYLNQEIINFALLMAINRNKPLELANIPLTSEESEKLEDVIIKSDPEWKEIIHDEKKEESPPPVRRRRRVAPQS